MDTSFDPNDDQTCELAARSVSVLTGMKPVYSQHAEDTSLRMHTLLKVQLSRDVSTVLWSFLVLL